MDREESRNRIIQAILKEYSIPYQKGRSVKKVKQLLQSKLNDKRNEAIQEILHECGIPYTHGTSIKDMIHLLNKQLNDKRYEGIQTILQECGIPYQTGTSLGNLINILKINSNEKQHDVINTILTKYSIPHNKNTTLKQYQKLLTNKLNEKQHNAIKKILKKYSVPYKKGTSLKELQKLLEGKLNENQLANALRMAKEKEAKLTQQTSKTIRNVNKGTPSSATVRTDQTPTRNLESTTRKPRHEPEPINETLIQSPFPEDKLAEKGNSTEEDVAYSPSVAIDAQFPEPKRKRQRRDLADEELAKRAMLKDSVQTREVTATAFIRDNNVSELAKRRAKGICNLCENPAPFKDEQGNPYLESHHIEWLSKDGEDTIENTVALCPNCHRKMHVLGVEADIKKLCNIAKVLSRT